MNIQFLYIIENLSLYSPDIIESIVALIFGFIFLASLWALYTYSVWYVLIWKEQRALANKKNVLGDLILMKDIQSEMEKEIEQATLKATFQG